MADRPIPFKGPMVRAIIEDRKTQTRRVLDPQPVPAWSWSHPPGTYPSATGWTRIPYAPGDRLWVREAWRAPIAVDHLPPRDIWATTPVCYEADGSEQPRHDIEWGRFRHSMFMPRWASRLTLIVESVRIERLQEITEEDAIAEGTTSGFGGGPIREDFFCLWNSINGPFAADENPWVAAITFRGILANIDHPFVAKRGPEVQA